MDEPVPTVIATPIHTYLVDIDYYFTHVFNNVKNFIAHLSKHVIGKGIFKLHVLHASPVLHLVEAY